jgi:protein ImuB
VGYAAIYIPEFPSLAWLRLEPCARSQAVAVVEGNAPLERIVSFNRASRALGLEHGMSKVQADTSGQILFHTRSIAEEQAALDVVFEIAEGFSPRVQIIASLINQYAKSKQPAAVLLLDQTGTEKLFGSARSFAEKLRKALHELDFPSNVAVAPNAEASLLLARGYSGVTRSISEMCKPSSLLYRSQCFDVKAQPSPRSHGGESGTLGNLQRFLRRRW